MSQDSPRYGDPRADALSHSVSESLLNSDAEPHPHPGPPPLHLVTMTPTFAGWRQAARRALRAEWSPEEVMWEEEGSDQPLLNMGQGEYDADREAEAGGSAEPHAEAES